jgi:lysophospholipase L1-like esterase
MIEYEPYINVKNFIGWPCIPRIGGFHIEEKTLWYNEEGNFNEKLIVSNLDVHPNGKGHEKIAEFLYGQL